MKTDMKKTGFKPTDIASILISHVHPDHVAGLAALKDASDAEVAAHEIEAAFTAKRENYPGRRIQPVPTHPSIPTKGGVKRFPCAGSASPVEVLLKECQDSFVKAVHLLDISKGDAGGFQYGSDLARRHGLRMR